MSKCSQIKAVMGEWNVYDVAVVGAGMIGSAAARHLAEEKSTKVLLIGPKEPQDRQIAEIFGAHQDEGRVVRNVDSDPVMSVLAARSVARFRDIEARSGIKFFSEVGYMAVGNKLNSVVKNIYENAKENNMTIHRRTSREISKNMPFLEFPDDYECVYTESGSGYISPRLLVKAEKYLAAQSGCDVIDDVVKQLVHVKTPTKHLLILTDQNRVFRAKRVLLATGAFSSSRQLIPRELTPKLRVLTETVTKLRIGEAEARRLDKMPSLSIIEGAVSKLGHYILPPILYPNGYYYLKIGHGKMVSETLMSPEKMTQWQQGYGDPAIAASMQKVLTSILPGIKVEGVEMDSCLTSHTANGYPYIDMLTDDTGVAIGGCGRSAKSCDEIGRLAARLIIKGHWPADDINRDHFRYQYTDERSYDKNIKSRI